MPDHEKMGRLVHKADRRCRKWVLRGGPEMCYAHGVSRISEEAHSGGPANSPEGALHDLLEKMPPVAPPEEDDGE